MRVKRAKYVKDYKVKLLFSDGVEKEVDFKPFLSNAKNLLLPLTDLNYFKQFSIDDSTICWPNEVDFCPDVLYEMGKEVKSKTTLNEKIKRTRTTSRSQIKRKAASALTKKRPK